VEKRWKTWVEQVCTAGTWTREARGETRHRAGSFSPQRRGAGLRRPGTARL